MRCRLGTRQLLATTLIGAGPLGPASAAVAALQAPADSAAAEAAPYPLPPNGYRVFTSQGAPSSLTAVVEAARNAEVVLLGEMHDDRIGHALQHEVFRRLVDGPAADVAAASAPGAGGDGRVVLSLEMFERDVQHVLDEYLSGLITEEHFLKSARPWPFYEEDYRPLLELARARGLRVVAANAPRRYVNRVTREGPWSLDALSAQAKSTLPPLPYAPPSAAYRARFEEEMARHRPPTGDEARDTTGTPRYAAEAQALWDAAMAYSIVESLLRHPDARVVHLVGSFHISRGLGLPEHLERYRPGTRTLTAVMQPVADPAAFPDSLAGLADFVVLTDSSHVRPRPSPAPSATHGLDERIVSLGASVTETLFALGAGDLLVGRDAASMYPGKARRLPDVGYGQSLNVEGILALRPTLVIGVDIETRARIYDQLRATGVRVVSIPDEPTLEGVRAKIRAIAGAVGREHAGEALVASLDNDIAQLEARIAERSSGSRVRALFLYLRGRQVTYVCGRGSAAANMLELAGAVDAATGIQECQAMTAESVVAAQPDAIVVYTRGLDSVGGVEGLLTLPAVAQTPAGRAPRIVALDDLYLGSFGPRTARAALDLHRALYDETGVFIQEDP